jgi:hypothetical protein
MCSNIEKKKKKNKKAQGKVINPKGHFVLPLKTPRGCEWI